MKFEYTPLRKDAIIEDAFNYAQDHQAKLAPEVTQQIQKQIDEQYQKQLLSLDDARDAGYVTEDQYRQNKIRLDNSMEHEKRRLPMIVQQQLEYLFASAKLSPALELQANSDNPSSALIAAAMLVDCVRDPQDYKKLEAKFGAAVAGLVAEVLHIQAYPGTALTDIATASSDAKRIFMAGLTTELNQVVGQIAMMPPGSMVQAPPQYEENIFSQVKALWGNDKKQDKNLVEVFNRAAEALFSSFRIVVTPAGAPALIENAPIAPPPAAIPGQKKDPKITWGDDKAP